MKPLRRPATARPREATPALAEPLPPDRAELEAIGRQLVSLWEFAGATVAHLDDLDVELVTWPERGLAFNHGARPRWSEATWTSRADALVARLQGLGQVPALVVVEELDRPPGLAERLLGAGWLEIGREAVFWTRRAGVVPHLDPALRIEALTAPRVADYEAIERTIFGLAAGEAPDRCAALEAGLANGRLRAYLVRIGETPVALARLIQGEGIAALQGIGVVAEHRRQGYGRLITTIATRAGLAGGARLVWLSVESANEPAKALYENLDYRPALTWRRLLHPGARLRR
jgi:ribosomal protein S18 acetylase RimI-like enzyme